MRWQEVLRQLFCASRFVAPDATGFSLSQLRESSVGWSRGTDQAHGYLSSLGRYYIVTLW